MDSELDCVMSDIISSERQLETLIEDVRKAPALSRDLFVKIIEEGGTRLWSLKEEAVRRCRAWSSRVPGLTLLLPC